MQNPYLTMSDTDMRQIAIDYIESLDEGKRCESFIPYAREIKENINGATEIVTLRECLDITKTDFFRTLAARFINMTYPNVKTCMNLSIQHLSEDTRMKLIEAANSNSSNVLVNDNNQIFVMGIEDQDFKVVPEDLAECMNLAKFIHISAICFGDTGDTFQIIDDLPLY